MIRIKPIEARWIEISLYLIVTDTLKQHQNFNDVTALINVCHLFNNKFNLEEGISLTQLILTIPYFRPSKDEFVCLAKTQGMPRTWIMTKSRVGARRYKRILDRYRDDPPLLKPKLTDEEIQVAKEILKGFKIIRKVGAPDVSLRKTMGAIQKSWYGSPGYESLRLS